MPAALAREEHEIKKVRPDSGVLSRPSRHAAHASPQPVRRIPRRHHQPADVKHDAARASHTERASHIEHAPHSAREFLDAVREDAHPDVVPAPRRRMRRAHRDFHLSLPIVIAGVALFGQLLWLIYVKSMASSASHQTNKLDMKIAQMQDDIARAQKKISAATSTAQLQAWAKQPGMNLRLATQADIDLVSPKTKPRAMDETAEEVLVPAVDLDISANTDSAPTAHSATSDSSNNTVTDANDETGGGHANP